MAIVCQCCICPNNRAICCFAIDCRQRQTQFMSCQSTAIFHSRIRAHYLKCDFVFLVVVAFFLFLFHSFPPNSKVIKQICEFLFKIITEYLYSVKNIYRHTTVCATFFFHLLSRFESKVCVSSAFVIILFDLNFIGEIKRRLFCCCC